MKEGEEMAREKQETTTTMKPLSPLSQLFVSPSFYCVIVFTLGFKTRCNPSIIVEGIKNTWLKLPRFCCKVVMDGKKNGEAAWVPVNVRLEDHVIISDLDHSNIDNPDEFIEHYTSNLANTPMDMSKPLWEFHMLNIKTSNAESLGIGKFHHSMGDGMSIMSLILASSRKTSGPATPMTTATTSRHVDSNDKSWWLVAKIWLMMIKVLFITCIELLKSLLTVCFMRDTKTPLMGKPEDAMLPRKIIYRIISFDDVKLVKNAMKMKVNDVILGMTQAGISRYLSRKYGDGDQVAKKNKILEKIRLRGTVTINLRPNTKLEDLASMMAKNSKCRWGNYLGIVLYPLWVKLEDDPLEYIRRAKTAMDLKKISLESYFFYGFIKYVMKLFGKKIVGFLTKRIFGHTTLTFSNVMGPNEEMSFFEHPISFMAASALVGQQALILHYVSYKNKISINLAVDTSVIQDPHLLCDDMVESLDIFKNAILEKGVHKMEV